MDKTRGGKTLRLIDYAIGAARQGRTIAIIVNTDKDRFRIHKRLLEEAQNQGCKWVVGDGINGGNKGNIEVYQVAHVQVMEKGPGDYGIRNSSPEVLVDHGVLEDRYLAIIDQYRRFL